MGSNESIDMHPYCTILDLSAQRRDIDNIRESHHIENQPSSLELATHTTLIHALALIKHNENGRVVQRCLRNPIIPIHPSSTSGYPSRSSSG